MIELFLSVCVIDVFVVVGWLCVLDIQDRVYCLNEATCEAVIGARPLFDC